MNSIQDLRYARENSVFSCPVWGCIGSHSGVKLCRWTKSMLRGRGGCYKHAFYGIESHRCMEATPSLACANKCVFCWRHHTNPGANTPHVVLITVGCTAAQVHSTKHLNSTSLQSTSSRATGAGNHCTGQQNKGASVSMSVVPCSGAGVAVADG